MATTITRRTALLSALAASAAFIGAGGPAHAEPSWPFRHIKLIVGGAAGSVPDALGRLAADALSDKLRQPVVIDDRPGSGGILAMERLVASAPDGYTIGLGTVSQAVFNSYLYTDLRYDPQRDVVPICKLVTSSFVLVANPALGVDGLDKAVQLSQSDPNGLLIGIPANGSPPHIAAALLLQETGLRGRFVPFRSGPDALSGAIRGDVHLLIDGPTLIAPQVKDGRLTALVATGAKRQTVLPEVPTLSELGYKRAECESWMGLFAPVGTPPEIVARLNRECAAILDSEAYVRKLQALSFVPQSGTSEEFRAFIAAEHQRWSSFLLTAGLKLK